MSVPFRWDIRKREQLGRLVTGDPGLPSAQFVPELRICAARVVAFASDADLIFIGRSPENLFDYVSGILMTTSWSERCTLMNISLHVNARGSIQQSYPDAVAPGRELLAAYDLVPEHIIQHPRPIAFVDLVASGETFGHLAAFLIEWAREKQLDVRALKQKLRFVGITRRTHTSPNTWRWQQQARWTADFSPRSIKNVAIPWWLWNYWGNEQRKVTPTNPPWRWGTDTISQPVRDPAHLIALNLALYLYDLGNSGAERRAFADCLTRTSAMRESWYRSLILELR